MATALFQKTFLDPDTSLPLDLFAVRVENVDTGVFSDLTEGENGRWSAELEWGAYNIQYKSAELGEWVTAIENIWHGTKDAKTHAEGTTDQHGLPVITYTPTDSDDWPDPDPTTGQAAVDNLAARVTDVEAWDAGDIPYTPDDGDNWDDPDPSEIEGALDQLAERVHDLETGTAVAPTGIADYTDSLGIVVKWAAQDVNDIQYALKFLWKHTSESAPAIGDLAHQRRSLAVEDLITFFSRHSDLSASPGSNLILYYAVAARGRADADWVWSDVQSIAVTLPEYTQEFYAPLAGITCQCTGADGGTSELILAVREPNQFPSADGTPPAINTYSVPPCSLNYQYTQIMCDGMVCPDANLTLILRNATTGATKEITVSKTTNAAGANVGRILTENQSFLLEVLANAELQIYTLDAKNMGDVHIWLRRTLYTG